MKRILLASGQQMIDDEVKKFQDYEVLDGLVYRKDVVEAVGFHQPDILLLGEGLTGHESLMHIMLQLVKDFPKMRIVYLAGYVDVRDEKITSLGILVMAGIYDIIHEQRTSNTALKNILDNPKTEEQVSYLMKRVKDTNKGNTLVEFDIPQDTVDEDNDEYKNLFVVSSIKPGTGKSFVTTNIATAIANYGMEVNGRKPRVALIEADLQNLSVGTLLQIPEDKHNLKAVFDKISTVVNDDGRLTGDMKSNEEVGEFIKGCFKPYYHAKNLETLVGSQLSFAQLENVKSYHYVYLIDSIINDYDVVILDTNSSLTHVTTFPLLHMAKSCYYVLNLDFNNVRNNVRYKDVMKEIGIMDKVKYILNEDITPEYTDGAMTGSDIEDLIFTADHLDDSQFKLEARVPLLPKTVFLNRLYNGTPVVLDNEKYTLKARYELLKIANQIWPIKNFKQIEQELADSKTKKKKGSWFSK